MENDETSFWIIISFIILLTFIGCGLTIRHYSKRNDSKNKEPHHNNSIMIAVILLTVDITLLTYLISTKFRMQNGSCEIPFPGQKFCYTDLECNTPLGDDDDNTSSRNEEPANDPRLFGSLLSTEYMTLTGVSSKNEIITIEYPDGNTFKDYKMFINFDTTLPGGGSSLGGVYGPNMGFYYKDNGVSVYLNSQFLSQSVGKEAILGIISTALGSCPTNPGLSIHGWSGEDRHFYTIQTGENLNIKTSRPLGMTTNTLTKAGVSSTNENSIFDEFSSEIKKLNYINNSAEGANVYNPYLDTFIVNKQIFIQKYKEWNKNRKGYVEVAANVEGLNCIDPGLNFPLCKDLNRAGTSWCAKKSSKNFGECYPSCRMPIVKKNEEGKNAPQPTQEYERATGDIIGSSDHKTGYGEEDRKSMTMRFPVFGSKNRCIIRDTGGTNCDGVVGTPQISNDSNTYKYPPNNVFCWRGTTAPSNPKPENNLMGQLPKSRPADLKTTQVNYIEKGNNVIIGFE